MIVDQEYEMKPMIGVPCRRLLEKEPYSSKERVGNGDLKKYKSISLDNTSAKENGRFINVTLLSEIASADDNENVRTTEATVTVEDVCAGDLTEEAPQHKLSVAKSSCSDCTAEHRPSKCADLEERFEEMASNMQRLESRMETLIALLERSGIPSTSQNQKRDTSEDRERNCTTTSV